MEEATCLSLICLALPPHEAPYRPSNALVPLQLLYVSAAIQMLIKNSEIQCLFTDVYTSVVMDLSVTNSDMSF